MTSEQFEAAVAKANSRFLLISYQDQNGDRLPPSQNPLYSTSAAVQHSHYQCAARQT